MSDPELFAALQEGLVNPIKDRLKKTETTLSWTLVLLSINTVALLTLIVLFLKKS